MSALNLAPDFSLEAEAALQRFGILAMSGAGKSNAAVVLAEEMYDAGIPWVAIDPKGDWWGVRSSKSGKGDGLLVPVFGGLKGDVPLEETAGSQLAELIASKRLTCVLDISEMAKGAQLRFLTDFASTLLRINRAPLQVICEEADEYLPQRVMKREAPCVGAWSKLVKRGRFRGVFVTLVTQRSAALNKDALSQIDTLIPMRVGDPRDKKALREWVVEHDVGQEMFDSLPRLDDGEAWIWSPHKLKVMERIKFRRRRTFDSGATPDWEEREPAKLADIDLDAVKAEMTATIERAKAEDPDELRKQIRGLEKQLRERPSEPVEVEKIVEIPVLANGAVDALKAAIESVDGIVKGMDHAAGSFASAADKIANELQRINGAERDRARVVIERSREKRTPPPKGPARRAAPRIEDDGERLGGAPAKMLEVLVQRHPMHLTFSQLCTFSGYKPRSSTVRNALSTLRTRGYIEEAGSGRSKELWASEAGIDAAGAVPAPPSSPDEMIAHWRSVIGGAPQAIFDVLVEVYPDTVERDELAERAGYSPTSSTVRNAMSTLRRNGLIDEAGHTVAASGDLFMVAP